MQPLQLHLREELQRVARCNTLPPWKDQPLAQRFSECFVLQGEVCRFGNALLEEEAAKAGHPAPKLYPGCHHLLAFSMYGVALHRWLQTPGLPSHRVALVQARLRPRVHRLHLPLHLPLHLAPLADGGAGRAPRARLRGGLQLPRPASARRPRAAAHQAQEGQGRRRRRGARAAAAAARGRGRAGQDVRQPPQLPQPAAALAPRPQRDRDGAAELCRARRAAALGPGGERRGGRDAADSDSTRCSGCRG
eukprot:Transcript_21984.p3 GENE.Transcript_21984~~Transcript_21984.p3  ORF type:complete len:249 (-),score=43.02 Transcript_21984:62-808(-)